MKASRRQFLAASAAVVATRGLTSPGSPARAIDPIKRPGDKPDLKLSLAAYSYRKFLRLTKPTMTLFDFIDVAAWGPLEAVELTSYYFAETSDAYLDKLKARCKQHGLAISGVPVRNDFCQRDDEKRKRDIQHVKDWTERAGKLGAQTVRIFAGKIG